MICIRCKQEVQDGKYCSVCGWKQSKPHKGITRRSKREGTVWKDYKGKYRAVQRIIYRGIDGKIHQFARTRLFPTKEEAIAGLPALREELLKKHPEYMPKEVQP